MNIVLILFLAPALLYGTVWAAGRRGASARVTGLLLAMALVMHAASFLWPWSADRFHYGFAKLLSATVWIGVTLVWIESLSVDIGRLITLLAPLGIVFVVLPYFFPGMAFVLDSQAPLFVPHLIIGTLAYGVMFLAAMQALLMAAAEHRLHPRRSERRDLLATLFAGSSESLPPLMVLERILFRVIGVGFMLLLLTTLTGLFFSEVTFGRTLPVNHKTVFSLVATVFFGLLLVGRWLWGWRGRIAIRLTLGGFLLLMLSYAGSRFVLEVVLGRT